MAANHNHLLSMSYSRDAHLHIKGWHFCRATQPAYDRKLVALDLWPEALQIVTDFFCPVISELIMPIHTYRQIGVVPGFSTLELSGYGEKLIINIIGINRGEISQLRYGSWRSGRGSDWVGGGIRGYSVGIADCR